MATKIEWTDRTYNPVTGCTKIASGCKHCYSEKIIKRFWKKWGREAPPNHFKVMCHEDRVEQPLGWKKPSMIFICSMGDLFHENVPAEFVEKVWKIMRDCTHHTFQVLTKRPERMNEMLLFYNQSNALPNVWLGTSVSTQKDADENIPWLLKTPAAVRFVSYEPALEEVNLELGIRNIDQIICGAESGPGARPFNEDWARYVRELCIEERVSFFYKQNSTTKMPKLDGKVWDQMPGGST